VRIRKSEHGPENAAIEAEKRSCADVMQHQGKQPQNEKGRSLVDLRPLVFVMYLGTIYCKTILTFQRHAVHAQRTNSITGVIITTDLCFESFESFESCELMLKSVPCTFLVCQPKVNPEFEDMVVLP
jgi:hypothetical protein